LASEVTNLSGYQTKALNQFAHRNLVINGDMQIAQRATSVASITTEGYRTADRWSFTPVSLGTWTQTVENDAPTGSGFRKSLKVLCTTADASPAASDVLRFDYRMEGQNLQHIKKGTAAAEQLTLSFWVKANVTGTYIIGLYDYDNTRYVAKSYTVNASATWEYKTITFPADTTGALDNDNATSLEIEFGLATGTDRSSGTLATTWQSYTAANALVGQVNLASATNNYWQITGVQLEVGDTATPFEFKSVEDELLECQRYYWRTTATGSAYATILSSAVSQTNTNVYVRPVNPVPMRDVSSSIEFSNIAYHRWDGTLYAITAMSVDTASRTIYSSTINATVSGPGASTAGAILANNNTAAYFAVNAEL
jgi:hypothetical protein